LKRGDAAHSAQRAGANPPGYAGKPISRGPYFDR
jgi:hypothetical protein